MEPQKVVGTAKGLGLRIEYVINRHADPDHAQGSKKVRQETGAKIVMHHQEPGNGDADILVGRVKQYGLVALRSGLYTPLDTHLGACAPCAQQASHR
ncbi:MAG: hypothetical protein DRO11_00870 [Methanobacteriota archaeon]|nr:MAG: hypothetical protein DRO11_00870 [Euryarchaeota archaeon]